MMCLAGSRVLLVEDEGAVALLIEDMLEDLGCSLVASIGRVPAATRAAGSLAFDIAVLDVNVAEERVFPVCDVLIRRGIPFVFSTGYGSAGICADLTGFPVLTKPFTLEELRSALVAAFEQWLETQGASPQARVG